MTAETASRSVLFADISDSTRAYEALGVEGGRRLILECLELMRQVVERGGGTVVDRIGDELMCTFADPAGAGRASCELHRAFESAGARLPAAVRLRIGFHHGPLVIDEDRIFGDTIAVAKRVESLAKPQQTLATRQATDAIPLEEQLVTRFVDRTHLKGKAESFDLFEIVWDTGVATIMAHPPGSATRLEPSAELALDDGQRTYTIDGLHPTLTIGRGPGVDVVIHHERVSRLHARIEYRRDTFVFVDQSTNGSQVIEAGEARRYVRRDECRLVREGKIVLGPESSEFSFPSLAYRLGSKDRAG